LHHIVPQSWGAWKEVGGDIGEGFWNARNENQVRQLVSIFKQKFSMISGHILGE